MWGAWLLLVVAPVLARDITEEEYARFPRLYHLDEYAGCLARRDGLYCLGTLDVAPLREPDPLYSMMREYSRDPHHFNRTQLHRGYCVSARCPAPAHAERNSSLRFERCAAQWARRRSLRVQLAELSYCRSHAQEFASAHSPEPLSLPHRLFLAVVALLLLCNVVGTVYDVTTGDDVKKNAKLVCWSVRSNWRRLTATYEDGDPRLSALSPVQGVRVLLMGLTLSTHAGCIHDMLYLYNPRWIEQVSRHPLLMLFVNGTSVVQVSVLVSGFLLGYNMLLVAHTYSLTYSMLPYIIAKRVSRTWPLHVLVVGYSATWWYQAGSGPMWPLAVGAESQVCRNKFWTHALYLNNLVHADDICLVQTWFVAVDFQLYVVTAALSLYLVNHRERAIPVLAALVVGSSALNGLLAYAFHWQSLMYFVYPSTLRSMYQGIPSFSRLYTAPWGSLPAACIGLLLAHLHHRMQDQGVKLSTYRWVRRGYTAAPLVMGAWILAGYWVRRWPQRGLAALYVALERPVLAALGAIVFLGIINGFDGFLRRLFAWRGWHSMGRLSLAVLVAHWPINLALAAARPQPIATSALSVITDFLATGVLSYLVAVPLTLLVEMPAQRFVAALLF